MTNPIIIDEPDVPSLPTAKAYLTIDLAPLGHVTGAAEVPGNHAGAVIRTLTSLGGALLVGIAPALTIYVSRNYLSAEQCLALVIGQLALTVLLAGRPTNRSRHLHRPK